MAVWVGAQGQVTSAKKTRKKNLLRHPPQGSNPKLTNFLKSKLEDFPNP